MNILKHAVYGLVGVFCVWGNAFAHDPIESEKPEAFQQDVRNFVEQMTRDNDEHVNNISKMHLKTYLEDQSPRATVVSCSDSRVQTDAYHNNPINDLFYIRNIGNQIQSAEGSVEYGINHLKTPILLIIGHSQCGAIHAAMGDYSKESKAIKKELDTLDLIKGNDTDEGVMANIHNQVHYAMTKFKDKIEKKELTVIGVIYDFRDDFGRGHGKMIVIDVNGDADAERLKDLPILQNIKGIAIGEKRLKSADVPTIDKATPEKAVPEKAAPEKATGDKAAAKKSVSEKAAPEKAAGDKAAANKMVPEKSAL